jgi:hypothetical protein
MRFLPVFFDPQSRKAIPIGEAIAGFDIRRARLSQEAAA